MDEAFVASWSSMAVCELLVRTPHFGSHPFGFFSSFLAMAYAHCLVWSRGFIVWPFFIDTEAWFSQVGFDFWFSKVTDGEAVLGMSFPPQCLRLV